MKPPESVLNCRLLSVERVNKAIADVTGYFIKGDAWLRMLITTYWLGLKNTW